MFRTRPAAVLIAGTVAVALSACGTSADEAGAPDASFDSSGEISGEITVWTWDGAPGTEVMQNLAAAFEEETGVTVTLATPDRENYVAQSQLALNSGDPIDVLGIQPSLSAQDLATNMVPVSEYADQLQDGLDGYNPAALEQMRTIYGEEEIYSVPFGSTGSAVCFYNKDILDEVGVEAPETWDDVAALAAALEAQKPGVLTLVAPSDTWFQDELVLTMVEQEAPGFFNEVRYEDGAWNAPGYVDGLARYGELYEEGTLPRNALDLPYADAMNAFNTGQAAIVCNGSWEAAVLLQSFREENGIDIDAVGAIPVPADSPDDRTVRSFLDITWGVPTTSTNPAAAAAFISFATQGAGIDIWAGRLGFVPAATDWTLEESVFGDDEVAAEGYSTIQGLIEDPSSDRNNLSSFSGQVGTYVLEVAQGRMTAQDAADAAQEDLTSGLYQ